MWVIWVETAAAVYLVGGALIVDTKGIPSALLFKATPMAIGMPLAFSIAAKLLGWPV